MTSFQLPLDYQPENDTQYMAAAMLLYFKNKLEDIKKQFQDKTAQIKEEVQGLYHREPDPMDESVNEELIYQDSSLRTYDEQRLQEIEAALQRIAEGSYGYCEVTGVPIGVERLQRVPYARYCYEIQKEKEAKK